MTRICDSREVALSTTYDLHFSSELAAFSWTTCHASILDVYHRHAGEAGLTSDWIPSRFLQGNQICKFQLCGPYVSALDQLPVNIYDLRSRFGAAVSIIIDAKHLDSGFSSSLLCANSGPTSSTEFFQSCRWEAVASNCQNMANCCNAFGRSFACLAFTRAVPVLRFCRAPRRRVGFVSGRFRKQGRSLRTHDLHQQAKIHRDQKVTRNTGRQTIGGIRRSPRGRTRKA